MPQPAKHGKSAPFILSVVLHAIFFVAIVLMTMQRHEPLSLSGSEDGESVTVSLAAGSTAGERSAPPPQATPRPTPKATPRPEPDPEPEAEEPQPKQTPAPRETPAPEKPKPTPTPKPQSTPRPTAKPESTPKPTPAPKKEVEKPKPTPTKSPAPSPTKAPEKRREPARTPSPKKAEPKATPFVMTPELSGKLRQRLAPGTTSSTSAVKASNKTSNSTAGTAAGKSAVGSSSGSAMKEGAASIKGHGLPDYYARLALEKLARNFRIPPEDETKKEALVGFRIDRDGTLSRIRITRSTGDSKLDAYATAAVERTARLAPFPDDFEKEYLDVEVGFSFVGQ